MTALIVNLEGFNINETYAAVERRFPGASLSNCTFVNGRFYDAADYPNAKAMAGGTTLSSMYTHGTPDLPFAGLPANSDCTWWVFGAAMYVDEMTSQLKVARFRTSGVDQLTVQLWEETATTFKIRVYRGTTLLEEGTTEYAYGAWYYFEVRAHASTASAGSVEVRMNESTEISISGAQTSTDESWWNKMGHDLQIQAGGSFYLDDCYWECGDTIPPWYGDLIVCGLLPNGDGNQNDWTPQGGGANYVEVDEPNNRDDDTTYVYTDQDADVDLYDFENLPAIVTGAIAAVQVEWDTRLVASGSRNIRPRIRSTGPAEAAGTTDVVDTTSYSNRHEVFEQNPVTVATWSEAEVDAMEAGMETVA